MSKQIIVKYKKNGNLFEVLCKGGTIEPFRNGKCNIEKCLVADEIFKNSSKFDKAKSSDLKKAFGTENKMECIHKILMEGDFPLTKDEINTKTKQKHDEIVNYIVKYYHDASKDPVIPHPQSRIEAVLQEMRIKIDPNDPVQNQLKPIIKKLPDFLRVKPVGAPIVEAEMMRHENKKANENKKASRNRK